jgi:hypothetical protein
MSFPVVYNRAVTPARGPQPGALALMAWALHTHPTGRNLGIFNPRRQRGRAVLSIHAEGRAIDVGFPVQRPDGHPDGWRLSHQLVAHHRELGIQCVIFARRIWTNTRAGQGWRPYTGAADHFDHVHAELTVEAARRLTIDMIRAATAPPPPPAPKPAPPTRPTPPPTRQELDVLFHQAMADLDEIYLAYRGALPTPKERQGWGRVLAHKLYTERADLTRDLAWLQSELAKAHPA